jgi:hypothetical protein
MINPRFSEKEIVHRDAQISCVSEPHRNNVALILV